MNLVKRRRYNPELTNLFDDFLTKDFFPMRRDSFLNEKMPPVNILDEDKEFKIDVVCPGLNKSDFKLELHGGMLTISFEKNEETEENGKYTKREFIHKSFERSFTLPKDGINTDKISAKYKNGIMSICLPKSVDSAHKGKKLIQIN